MFRLIGTTVFCLAALTTHLAAQTFDTPAAKIAVATLPLQKALRDGATVIDLSVGGKVDTLRKGSIGMVCAYRAPTVASGDNSGEKTLLVSGFPEWLSALVVRRNAIQRELAASGKP